MRTQMCLMPAKCVKCDELFDLSYDFEKEDMAEKEVNMKKCSKLLCWECRLNGRGRK